MQQADALDAFRDLIRAATSDDGPSLTDLDRSLLRAGLASSVPSLNRAAVRQTVAEAFAAGATPQQLQEVVSVVSGLGVHSLMISAVVIVEEAHRAGYDLATPLDPDEQRLWDKRVGHDPFWHAMEAELPGFLRAMLRLSSDQFEAFFEYCAVPWKSGTVKARTKELLALASDAMPAHRFMPGFRLHLANAVKLGAGRIALLESLELARQAPTHCGA